MVEPQKKGPNFLLHGFILVSLIIHFFIFLHVAGLYESRALSYIELTMHQVSKPHVRAIPKPRVREKNPDIADVETIQVDPFNVPKIKLDPLETGRPDLSQDRIHLPRMPDRMDVSRFSGAGLDMPPSHAGTHEDQIEFTTAKEYFEMLNLRIHSFKQYPESAKTNHIEGSVKIEFIVTAEGRLTDIRIIKSSRHKNLDDAAIEAVKKAAPFPRPPPFLFTPPITMQINILFELA